MRVAARISLAVVVLLAGVTILPRPASRVLSPDATAQIPTPSIPDVVPKNSPSPSPGDDDDDGDKKDRKDRKDRKGDGDDKGDGKKKGKDKKKDDKNKKKKKKKKRKAPPGVVDLGGRAFTTEKLIAVAAQLRSLGWTHEEVIERVYPPFIIAGEATWINTWGAPRYGPGPIVRTHEGQDVFCEFGNPVLATEPGIIEFDAGGLGGLVARLYTEDGRYWYYAHLSDWNTEDFATGDQVETGDVIGYCGNTGNAITTPPHVHFGWYKAGGTDPQNPMRPLKDWLRQAESNVVGLVAQVLGKKVKQQPQLTAKGRFGDGFTPDRSVLRIPGESLWASGSYPATGALGLAQSALQAALSTSVYDITGISPTPPATVASEPTVAPSPNGRLAEILGGRSKGEAETAD